MKACLQLWAADAWAVQRLCCSVMGLRVVSVGRGGSRASTPLVPRVSATECCPTVMLAFVESK